jgi:hypothetical protein
MNAAATKEKLQDEIYDGWDKRIFYRTTSDELPGLGSICTVPLVRDNRPLRRIARCGCMSRWGSLLLTIALTAAICFSVASFFMSRSVKPHQP